MEKKKDQLIHSLFEEVKQELAHQIQSYKTEVQGHLKIHVPLGDETELKKFISEQKRYYENYFTNEFGRPSGQKFDWEQYQLFMDSWNTEELTFIVENHSKKREFVNFHARHFLYAEIANYLNSLVYDKSPLPDWEVKKHEVIIRYEKMNRKKGDGITDLTLRQSIAYYEIQTKFSVSLSALQIPLSNIAMSISLSTGYEKDSIEKEINNVTPQDYKVAWQKFKEIAEEYSPPLK